MQMTGKSLGINEGVDVLVVYPVEGGKSVRFQPGTSETIRHFDTVDRLYEPARLLEGISMADAVAEDPAFAALAKPAFDALLMAVASDVFGDLGAARLTILRERHHLIVVDTDNIIEL